MHVPTHIHTYKRDTEPASEQNENAPLIHADGRERAYRVMYFGRSQEKSGRRKSGAEYPVGCMYVASATISQAAGCDGDPQSLFALTDKETKSTAA